ncbi:cobalt-precorrin-6A reductase [Actinocorallia sp. API 0066]|uniref:cobalt-precorrin-6A reductase n=1 Tax=Actinocorallia sp. API 0066 TaxID=2896846 RepID=UPI001E5362DE|nr:cobalt-precorrin-6A reductase [Actinocorallia sp. API 0066]MCD0448829.1 cobalt-precorrin-6A reductase [Actinocorallia sp. API 0066]
MRSVLVLGGTGEARRLADALSAVPRLRTVSSLAGRVARPALPSGEVRTGGFGGPEGLAAWLAAERIDLLVDATHPFASGMTASAAEAASRTGVPLLVLRRPGWEPVPGDRWRWASDVAEAARALPGLGHRVFLTTGRQTISAFAHLDDLWFLARSVDPPAPPLPRNLRTVLDRGPFTLDGELGLMREHAIDVLVTKDSGGPMTSAKLAAARALGVPVLLVRRPPLPEGVAVVSTTEAAVAWVRDRTPQAG